MSFPLKPARRAGVAVLAGVMAVAAAGAADAAMIGVNFQGGGNGVAAPGTLLLPTDSAGFVPQNNFNNVNGGSGTNLPLIDDTGASITTTLTFTSGGTYASSANPAADGNEKLFQGFVFGNSSVTVTGVPYSLYDLYVYQLNDAGGRVQTTSLTAGGPAQSFYGSSATPGGAGYVDANAGTPFTFTQATSTDVGSPTANATYVKFAGLTSSTFTVTTSAPGNGFLNGFQVVQVPEPGVASLLGLAAVGLLVRRRRQPA